MSQQHVLARRDPARHRGQAFSGRRAQPVPVARRAASTYTLTSLGTLFATANTPAGARASRAPGRPARASSRRAQARRRRVLGALIGAFVVAAVLAVATGEAAAWWATLAVLPLVCSYLALLARARRVAAVREFNSGFLSRRASDEMGLEEFLAGREPAQVSPRQLRAGA